MRDNKKAPCYGCERRDAHCHSSCEDYKRFSQERVKELEAIRKQKADEAMVTAVMINSIKRCTKDITANKQNAWKGR